jgi:hypothetical protein
MRIRAPFEVHFHTYPKLGIIYRVCVVMLRGTRCKYWSYETWIKPVSTAASR